MQNLVEEVEVDEEKIRRAVLAGHDHMVAPDFLCEGQGAVRRLHCD